MNLSQRLGGLVEYFRVGYLEIAKLQELATIYEEKQDSITEINTGNTITLELPKFSAGSIILYNIIRLKHHLNGLNDPPRDSERVHIDLSGINNRTGALTFDNLIQSNANNFLTSEEGEEKLMRTIKNTRKRADGRYEWRKTVGGITHQIINSRLTLLAKLVSEYKKKYLKPTSHKPQKIESRKLYDLCLAYYNRHKKGKIKSDKSYQSILNQHLNKLTRNIEKYTKDNIIDFLDSLPGSVKLCYHLLKNTFADATEKRLVKLNVILNLKQPKREKVEKTWFNPSEQRLILSHKDESKIGDEIVFLMMTGCRLSEAPNCMPDFDNCRIFVKRTKSNGTSGYVKISKEYSKELRPKWNTMFKMEIKTLSVIFTRFLKKLGIKRKENSLHSLRHTFASNIYYLGVPIKMCQYLLGHKSIRVTMDTYTTLDPTITKQDIINIHGSRYPKF